MNKRIPDNILKTVKIYLIVLAIFFCFRMLLFAGEFHRLDAAVAVTDIFRAFIMGIRFDIVIAGYILMLPFFLLTLLTVLRFDSVWLRRFIFYFIFILFSLAFGICAIEIPYFRQFFSRFSVTAFEWLDSPAFVFKMIIQEPRYWLYVIPFILAIVLLYRILKKIILKKDNLPASFSPYLVIIFSVLFMGIMFLGIRGRLALKSPIRVGTAYFCNNALLNQLGLNPNFTLIRSYLDSRKDENNAIRLMDSKSAIRNVQQYLGITRPDAVFPLKRPLNFGNPVKGEPNVILIIMESMSAAKMARNGNTEQLTPFLDSLSQKGYYFENAYTAGIHTFNGIFSSLFSYPALFRQHPMKESSILKYSGIATTLKERNYSTIYFTTHDGQFDNVEGFLKANDFERVVSQPDYPSAEVKSTLGVPDDFMFRYSIPVLNELEQKQKPFFAAFMTASDHGPFIIPGYYKPSAMEIHQQIVQYADYSLETFMRLASRQNWFRNTLFVFVADHGAPIDATYDISLDYHHSPLLFFSPSIISEPKVFDQIAGQIDIFPSIMGLLRLSYVNNNLGINLFNEERPYIIVNDDDKYGVIDKKWLLIISPDKPAGLFWYQSKDPFNYASEQPAVVKKMQTYAESSLQAYQHLILNRKM